MTAFSCGCFIKSKIQATLQDIGRLKEICAIRVPGSQNVKHA